MTHKYLLGIDIGTTGTKILLIDLAGGVKSDVNLACHINFIRCRIGRRRIRTNGGAMFAQGFLTV